jgi:RNA polymerase primary sigma factor
VVQQDGEKRRDEESTMNRKHEDSADRELVTYYLAEVKKTPLLSAEKEVELGRASKNGSTAARNKLVQANLRLVVKIAYEYHNCDTSLMDLIQEGNIGLVHAAEKFDPEKDVRFSTYSALWIKQTISRFLDSKKRAIRLPNRKEEMLRKIRYVYHDLLQKLARVPSDREIAQELGIDTSEVRFLTERGADTVSLETALFQDTACSVEQVIEDYTYSPEQNYLKEASTHEVLDFLNSHLLDKEKNVLMDRYEFNGVSERHSLKKIGERIGVTPEAVRQIELRALRKIKSEYREFKDCLYA